MKKILYNLDEYLMGGWKPENLFIILESFNIWKKNIFYYKNIFSFSP